MTSPQRHLAQPGATPPGATPPGATPPGATLPGATLPGATLRRVAAAGALALLVAACGSPAAATPTPRTAGTALNGKPLDSCQVYGVAARCGELFVPENRSIDDGRMLTLLVVVLPATDPAAAAATGGTPIFMLAGGPGGAATESFGYTLAPYAELHRTHDFVMMDQRGTGKFGRQNLVVQLDTTGMDASTGETAVVAAVKKVLPGVEQISDPKMFTSWEAAKDLDALRVALGYDQVDVFGGSYGATMAQVYLASYPEHVRTATVTGVSLLDVPLFEHMAVGAQEALDKVFARCRADSACHAAYPNLEAEFAAVMSRLSTTPVRVPSVDPLRPDPIYVDRNVFSSAVEDLLSSIDLAATLPRAIHRAAAGQFDVIASTFTGFSDNRMQIEMYWSIRCSEAWAAMDPAATERKGGSSFFTPAMVYTARLSSAACSVFPRASVPSIDGQAVHSDRPVLFLVGGADPADPPENSANAPTVFPNSATALFPASGHSGTDTYGCAPALVTKFINSGTTKGLDVSCAASAPVPPFDVTP
jgi:pimeloyl-ACP methyl ester carboxylesterase